VIKRRAARHIVRGFDFYEEPAIPACVYFLVDSTNVIRYVGQTIELVTRVSTHRHQKGLYRAFYIPVDIGDLTNLERALIRLLRPRLNGAVTIPYLLNEDLEVLWKYGFGTALKLPRSIR